MEYFFREFIPNINELINNINGKIDDAISRLKRKANSLKSPPNVYFDISINNISIGRIIFKVKCKNIFWKIKNQ